MGDYFVPQRSYFPGMGEAVADRTVNRKIFTEEQRAALPEKLKINRADPRAIKWLNAANLSNYPAVESDQAPFFDKDPELRSETWIEVAKRVAEGNIGLAVNSQHLASFDRIGGPVAEMERMKAHLSSGTLLMSGRHLQHGDANQKHRPMEVFTNCSTAAASFLLFHLLLNGSGVGRAYDDDMMLVDWNKMPWTYVTIDMKHPDRQKTTKMWVESLQAMADVPMISPAVGDVQHYLDQIEDGLLLNDPDKVLVHTVDDSREGWRKAFEVMERMAFEGKSDWILILDFSRVRQHGSPIKGMQNRPSSGPAPVMQAIQKIASVKLLNYAPWKATMYVDHYAAECVLVGGARRAARMATKTWRDQSIFEFIDIKRGGELWSSNNSVTIDEEFRERCRLVRKRLGNRNYVEAASLLAAGLIEQEDLHAWNVLVALSKAAYFDGTGEPGIINQDKLTVDDTGIEEYVDGLFADGGNCQVDADTLPLMQALAKATLGLRYTMITNPCGEITLLLLGGYCVIADVVPFHAADDDMAENAMRTATRALIRTNLMQSLYDREVKRTNRIGVGITGFHEWAYDRFKLAWKDIVNERKSKTMWLTLSRFKRAIVEEARIYAQALGVTVPHTNTTFKPAGTTSKLFGLCEGAHLPAKRWYLRWVQFRNDDPLIAEYEAKGYPVRRDLKSYEGTTIVGFPTAPTICSMDGGDWVTTASQATPEEQYEFLRLLEKYWIVGVEADGVTPLAESGNQVSYTLKYDPAHVSFEQFLDTLIDGQFSIRCCSVMPQVDTTAYEYQPEEPITKDRYEELMAAIGTSQVKEDVDFSHIDCGSGACPIDWNTDDKQAA